MINAKRRLIGIDVPKQVIEILPSVHKDILGMPGELAADETSLNLQEQIRSYLMDNPVWREWIHNSLRNIRQPFGYYPILLNSGLGIEKDGILGERMLVGLALSLESAAIGAQYEIEQRIVTSVIAKEGASHKSHARNDFPAAPHTAEFFGTQLPKTLYFSCIRPHYLGGAETTVFDLDVLYEQLPREVIAELKERTYTLETPKRLESMRRGYHVLTEIEGALFLRYRADYMVGIREDETLQLLSKIVNNPLNHYVHKLESGQTIIQWNGTPHSRLAQTGQTPIEEEKKRKLIRMRTVPTDAAACDLWYQNFRDLHLVS